MALISRKYGFLFIMPPRTGCTAIYDTLTEALGAERIPAKDMLDDKGMVAIPWKHTRLKQLLDAGIVTPEERKDLFVFTTVRNPFDSLVSLYAKKSGRYQDLLAKPNSWIFKIPRFAEDIEYCRNHTFDQWIMRSYWPPWWQRVVGAGRKSMLDRYAAGTDFVMRFETLQRDLDTALAKVGAPRIEVPRINRTEERPADYRSQYTPATRRAVEYTFRDDLKKYGYSF